MYGSAVSCQRHIVSLVESEGLGFLLIVLMMAVKFNVFMCVKRKLGKDVCIWSLDV